MPSRDLPQLKQRIDQLCTRAINTPDSPELMLILRELRDALHEHIEELRLLASAQPPAKDEAKP